MDMSSIAQDMWMVRQATLADEGRLRRLIARAERVALRFHAHDVGNYLTLEPFLLAEESDRLRGFLAFFMRRPPQAALVAAGLDDDWAPSPWLDRLLLRCVARLRARGAAALSYLGSAEWLLGPLQERGFCLVSYVIAYEKSDWSIPDVGSRSVDVRAVRLTDFSALVVLDRLAFHPLWRNSIDTLQWWKEALPYFVVAEVGEEVVGYCCCSVEQVEHGHLIRMAVQPAWQGRGIGTRLLAEAVRFFRQAGARRMTLNTQKENERAQRLYRKFGFRLMGREAGALWMDL
jgi:ribosomal protein S18 acetylase RimI-like enzyme